MTARLLVPGVVLLAAFLLWRGHNEPGGGFIAALVAGAAVALFQLAHGRLPRWLRADALVGTGLLLALGTGLLAAVLGEAFLAPFHLPLLGRLGIGSALLFDTGVLLMVLGLLVVTLERLGGGAAAPDPLHRLESLPVTPATRGPVPRSAGAHFATTGRQVSP
ncbi:MnhB domain-containing protein [Blastococcus sp. PRF04-17]|uniref:MnhB domain-containing protein n=1 Tax=Blastococcus sp. PRF04-17 TaxID=2933797 RepID=UPI001FF1F821|nr:MnhB domain-containing protein [Blastococcus sp. PRF04-17]UOX99962.1 MnhB domain-containing protein [Blastococcus sp. PRF04-17]